MLVRAIDSAKKACKNVEVIVVDDASTDNTPEVCRSIEGIKYIRLERNQKTAGARNIGIVASSAPYIAFLDDDDWRLPDSIESQIELLESDIDCGLVYGKYYSCNQQGEITNDPPLPLECLAGNILLDLLKDNFIPLSTVVIRKDCLFKVGLFDTSPQMVGIEDWDLWIRIAEFFSIKSLNQPISVYRKPDNNSGQWSSNITTQFSKVGYAYKNKWLKLPMVKNALANRQQTEKDALLERVSEKLLYDAAINSKGFYQKFVRFVNVARCYPPKMLQLNFYRTILKSLLT